MEFHEVQAPLDPAAFRIGAFGIAEPAEARIVKREKFGAAFFPLLAFDVAGGRLGHGKGFYDRYFAGYMGRKLGVAFEWQRSAEALPVEPHDVRLETVITEAGIHRF